MQPLFACRVISTGTNPILEIKANPPPHPLNKLLTNPRNTEEFLGRREEADRLANLDDPSRQPRTDPRKQFELFLSSPIHIEGHPQQVPAPLGQRGDNTAAFVGSRNPPETNLGAPLQGDSPAPVGKRFERAGAVPSLRAGPAPGRPGRNGNSSRLRVCQAHPVVGRGTDACPAQSVRAPCSTERAPYREGPAERPRWGRGRETA